MSNLLNLTFFFIENVSQNKGYLKITILIRGYLFKNYLYKNIILNRCTIGFIIKIR